jgi:hypothetical protein
MVVVGVVAGWLAGQIVQGTGFGLLGDLLIGHLHWYLAAAPTLMCTSAQGHHHRDCERDHWRHDLAGSIQGRSRIWSARSAVSAFPWAASVGIRRPGQERHLILFTLS